jgi:uncharacterized protein
VSEFRINISNLSEGKHDYAFKTEPKKIGLDSRFKEPLNLKVVLEKSSGQLLLRAEMQVEGIFECDRCLEQFARKFNEKYSLLYIREGRSTSGLKEEEIQVLSADANYIDLDEDVRQYISLAIPVKLLCREECRGICPVCGKNRNNTQCSCESESGDARWEPLKKLLNN